MSASARPESDKGVHDEFGVYIHVPFCRHRCDYCAFATWSDRDHVILDYMAALRADIARTVAGGMARVDTVFVGGGTPTRVPAELLMECLAELPLSDDAEVTVECNPDDVSLDVMRAYCDGGVNRISLGVQSMVPHVLQSLGRTHNPVNVQSAVEAVRGAGIEHLNLDIIYGVAGESVADWRYTVENVMALSPTHISAYGLTIEAGTPLADMPERHPDDDDQADKYEIVDDLLVDAGYSNYEISNWSLPGHECRHNMLYWRQGNYAGFGSAAHSHVDGRRWWNVRTPERYIEHVGRGDSTEASGESLTDEVRRREALELSLRTREGVPLDALNPAELDGLVEVRGTRVVLSRRGRLLANEVSLRLRP
jgi:oxygen-independent coproporphyrinogen-3 oxidase